MLVAGLKRGDKSHLPRSRKAVYAARPPHIVSPGATVIPPCATGSASVFALHRGSTHFTLYPGCVEPQPIRSDDSRQVRGKKHTVSGAYLPVPRGRAEPLTRRARAIYGQRDAPPVPLRITLAEPVAHSVFSPVAPGAGKSRNIGITRRTLKRETDIETSQRVAVFPL
jgi:hypothetical protein